jgi:hypothetical protein
MDLETEFRAEINRVKDFFDKNKKNDSCFFKLYNVPYSDTNAGQKHLSYSNFDTASPDDSISILSHQVQSVGVYGNQMFILKHYSGPNDSKPTEFVFRNPFYNPAFYRGASKMGGGIYGIGSQNSVGSEMLIKIVEQNHAITSSLKEDLMKLKHTYELEKKDSLIAELEEGNRTFKDAMIGFLEGETGTSMIMGIMGMIQQKFLTQPSKPLSQQPPPNPPSQQPPPPPKQEQPTAEVSSKQKIAAQKLSASLESLGEVFGSDGIDVVEHLSFIFKQRPELVDEFLKQSEGANDG